MIRASLLDFLNTGCLGPVRPGASMEEIVALLGEPKKTIGEPAPHATQQPYWIYHNLELNFDQPEGAASYLNYVEIGTGSRLRKKARRLAPNLLLELDGLNARSRPSQFIRAIEGIDRVEVCLADMIMDPIVTIIVDEFIVINLHPWTIETIEPPARRRGYIRRLDAEAKLMDIISRDRRLMSLKQVREHMYPGRYAPFMLTGREYLAALER